MKLVVTGNDTDVGKTWVTACLAASVRRAGRSVVAAKPIASGVVPGTWGDDAARLGVAAGHDPCVFARFVAPLSPHRAAALEGKTLDIAELRTFVADLSADVVLVEGVGGWRVPLDVAEPPAELRDLVRGHTVVVVAADRLGVLNHTRLTVEAARSDGFEVLGIVLNTLPGPVDGSSEHNAADLARLTGLPVARCPALPAADVDGWADVGDSLWATFGVDVGAGNVALRRARDSANRG